VHLFENIAKIPGGNVKKAAAPVADEPTMVEPTPPPTSEPVPAASEPVPAASEPLATV
jgi:hypothetical protein